MSQAAQNKHNSHKTLYADENANITVRDDIPSPDLAANELLIKVHYSGVNPADVKHSTELGIRSVVTGYDFAGIVLQAPNGSGFSEGNIVAGYTPTGIGRPTKYGTHQEVLAVPHDMAFRVPPNLPPSHAAALTVVAMTAADTIYNLFKAPLPQGKEPTPIEKPILIWGVSSSVGLCSLQFARASGFRNIFVTASPKRHKLLKELGATYTFDYASPTATKDISEAAKALGKGPIAYALDAAGTSPDLVLQTVEETTSLASVLPQGPRFQMPWGITSVDITIHPKGAPHPVTIPARPDDSKTSWSAFRWAIDNYGTAFQLPSVNVLDVTAEEAIETLRNVADGSQGYGKVVFKHPFK